MTTKWFGESANNNPKLPNEKLVVRYVHSGNKVLKIASVDITTGIFTTIAPIVGYTTPGTIIGMLVSYPGVIPSKLFNEWNGLNQYGLELITPTTFYVVNQSSANARLTSYAAGYLADVTQIQFEYDCVKPTIDLTGIELADEFRLVSMGISDRPGWRMTALNGTHSAGSIQSGGYIVDGRHFQLFYYEQFVKYARELGLFLVYGGHTMNRTWSGGSSWGFSHNVDPSRSIDLYYNLKFTSAGVYDNRANGSVIEIHNR